MQKLPFDQRGQSLIEALGALTIIAIVVSAIAISITTALNSARFNKDQTLATKYAQQGAEIVHQIRNDNYTSFTASSGTYCLGKGQKVLGVQGSCTAVNVDNFIRSVDIQQAGCAANVARVTVNVSFTDAKCATNVYCHKQVYSSCLSTVNPVQTP